MNYSFSHSYPWFTVVSTIFQFWQLPPISPSFFNYLESNLSQLKLQGEKTGRKGHLSVATEVRILQTPPPPPPPQPTIFLPFSSRNTSHPFVRSSSILNCLQFSVSDFWGGPFTLHGWGSQVWRRYSRISQGILITMPLHFVASIYNIIFFLLSEIMDCTDVGHGSLTSFTQCSGDSSATYPLMHS